MVFLSIILSFLISCTLIGQQDSSSTQNPYVAKETKVQKVLDLVKRLEHLARTNESQKNGKYVNGYLSQASMNEIDALLKELPESDELTRLALICGHLAFPQNADAVGYDEVFDRAMWEVAEILSKRIDDDAIHGLASLKRTHGTDGHGSEHLGELMEMQRKLKLLKQKKRR